MSKKQYDRLQVRTKRKYCRTTISDHRKASPNLLERQFHVALPDRVVTSDITYVPTNEGWLFVATVLDLCTRKIIGLAMRSDMTTGTHLPAKVLSLTAGSCHQYFRIHRNLL